MEKTLEVIDLFFTIILIGSLITNVPVVNKSLTWLENNIDQGFRKFIQITPRESIVGISNFFKKLFFITLFFMVFIFYLAPNFFHMIGRSAYLFLIFMMGVFGYFWMALTIAKPNKDTLIDIMKSSWYILTAPFIFGLSDVLLGTNIFKIMDAQIASSVDFFNLSILNNSITNTFILFTIFWYAIVAISVLGIWALSLPAYFSLWAILYAIYRYAIFFKNSKEKDRILYLIVFIFIINRLAYIFIF